MAFSIHLLCASTSPQKPYPSNVSQGNLSNRCKHTESVRTRLWNTLLACSGPCKGAECNQLGLPHVRVLILARQSSAVWPCATHTSQMLQELRSMHTDGRVANTNEERAFVAGWCAAYRTRAGAWRLFTHVRVCRHHSACCAIPAAEASFGFEAPPPPKKALISCSRPIHVS